VPLDADAQFVADMMKDVPPFYAVGIDAARARTASGVFPPPEVEVAAIRDLAVPAPGRDVPVRVYHPAPGTVLPVLMYLHGGGWSTGGVWTSDEACRVLATKVPCAVVSVDYRLAPEHKFPAGFEDASHVASWLARHAAEIGGDPDRIAVGGDSAGATLAAAVCVHARDTGGPRILAQVLAYPMTGYDPQLPSMAENAEAPMLHARNQ
jgi:acetyl esterase